MMQRLCSKLRSLALNSAQTLPSISSSSSRPLLHSSQTLIQPLHSAFRSWSFKRPLVSASSSLHPSLCLNSVCSSPFPLLHASSRDRRCKKKPLTPVISKVKKTKMKSFKSRFRTMNDGNVQRRKEGKHHNAHLKSKEAKRWLRLPATVPLAYAKEMKKLNFSG